MRLNAKERTDQKYLKIRRDRILNDVLRSEWERLRRPLTDDEVSKIKSCFKTAEALTSSEEAIRAFRESLDVPGRLELIARDWE